MARISALADLAASEVETAIASINPATGELLRVFRPFTDDQIETKLQRAAQAFADRGRPGFDERSRLLVAVADILERENEELARVITTEMGKLLRFAREEVTKCAWACRYFAESAPPMLADELVETSAKRSYVRYEPIGPILAVMTWNFPFWQVFRFVAPALMAGNVCLIKHAPNVSQCSMAIEDIFQRAGAPDGVLQALLVRPDQVEQILDDARVAAVTVTGSVETGRQVASAAGRRIKKVVLELGGNDAFIVMPSADLEEALRKGLEARIMASGQSCTAAKRFILAEPIADVFEHRFVEKMETLIVGDPLDDKSELGPLATARLVATLEQQVQKSAAAGCRILTGGKRIDRPGNYFRPTVLTDIKKNSPAYWEELYGPVAALFRVKNIEEAIELTNDSNFGLGASVWTKDPAEQSRFIEEIRVGNVFVNKRVRSDPRMPFGGMKASGFGRELGEQGLREFTVSKSVWIEEDS